MKPNRPDARGGHDRWLLSYADLVTLLLALFTTLYAASSVDARKLAPLQTSLREAFDAPPIIETVNPRGALVPALTATPGQTAQDHLQARLMQELSEALRLQRVDIHRDARGLVVTLPEEAAFATASTDVSLEARDLIDRVATAVRPTSGSVRIEGHTDDVPIRTARYSSNWELSTARASAVVAYLVESSGFDPGRLSAAGYGEFHPRVANDTPQNRARNRRIDIVILGTDR
ncbi:MAG TPA: flagellar motor protein MotB [Vicinamibacterales bacterium]